MYTLPTTVSVGEKEYNIRQGGDFRIILAVIAALQDKELNDTEKIITALMIFYEEFEEVEDVLTCYDIQALYQQISEFLGANDNSGHKSQYKLIDWVEDEQLIISGINNVMKTDVRGLEYFHWYSFVAAYMAIDGDSTLAYVVSIRDKLYRHKKLEKEEKEFYQKNPGYFKMINNQADQKELIDSIWNVEK